MRQLDFSFQTIALALILAVVGILIERRRVKIRGPLLVLREFRLGRAGSGDALITIRGRPAGIFAYLLAALFPDHSTTLVVTERDFHLEAHTLQGVSNEYVPMSGISSTECIYFRSLIALAAAFGIYAYAALSFLRVFYSTSSFDYGRQSELAALRSELWIEVVAGSVFYAVYVLSKRILIAIETGGGRYLGVAFKRSFIENTPIELRQAQAAVSLLNQALLAKHEKETLQAIEES